MFRKCSATLGQIPILSNLKSVALYGSSGLPVIDVVNEAAQGFKTVLTAQEASAKAKGLTRGIEGLLTIHGISGSSQAGQIARKIIDMIATRDETLVESVAESLVDLNELNPNLAEETFQEFIAGRPDLERKLRKEVRDLSTGITSDEIVIRNLGVENGKRAKAIMRQLNKLDTAREKNDLVSEYENKGIITDKVREQIEELVSQAAIQER